MSPHFLKRAKRIIGSIIIASVILLSGNLALAAAPVINSIEVSETSIKVVFDQEVQTIEDTASANYTYSAQNLANFALQSPTGASKVLSRRSAYSHDTDYISANNALKIYGLQLTQGATAQLTVQNIKNTNGETMLTNASTTTVVASTDPRVDNITPIYAKAGDSVVLTGVNFVNASSTVTVDGTQAAIASGSDTSLTITVPSLSASVYSRPIVVRTINSDESRSRPIYIYDATYGVITGTIKDTDGITAIDSVPIEAYTDLAPWTRYRGQSQKDGKFAIVAPAGTYNVVYTTPGAGSTGAASAKSIENVVTANSATSMGTVSFVTKVIYGTVYAPDGTTPIYGADVTVHNQSWTLEQHAQTGADGSYKIYVPSSTTAPQYTVDVTPSDYDWNVNRYFTTSANVNVTGAGPYLQNITIAAENVTGTVKTPTGTASDANPFPDTAVPSANVHIFKSDWSFDRWTTTDASGAFTFAGVANGTYNIELEPSYCGNQDTAVAKFCSYPRTRIDGVNVSGITILGNLRFGAPNFYGYIYADADSDSTYDFTDANSNNKCDPGETTEGLGNTWVNMSKDSFWTSGQTDSCGRYSFYLPSTGTYYISAQPPSGYASYSNDINVSTLPLTSPNNIKLSTPNVTGYVYGPTGSAGQANTWLNLCPSSGMGTCYGGGTSGSGAFSLNAPSDGTWQLTVNPSWDSFYIAPAAKAVVISSGVITTVGGDGNDVDEPLTTGNSVIIRLIDPTSDPNSFSGILYDPTGVTPQANIGISLRQASADGAGCGGEGMSRWTQTNSQGRYAFGDVTAGLYEIEAMPWGQSSYSRVRACHTITSDASTRTKNLNLTSPNITGTLASPSGSVTAENPTPDIAISNAWVSLYVEGPMNGGGWYGGNTTASGTFSFGGVNPGTYTLEVSSGWGSVYSSRRYRGVTLADGNGDGNVDTTDLNATLGVASANFPGKALRVATPNLKGRILNPSSQPVSNVWVMVHDQLWSASTGGSTDENGYFRVGGLTDGTYQIEVNLGWGGEQAFVAPSGLSVEVASDIGVIKQNGSALSNNTISLITPPKTITGRVFKDVNSNSSYDSGEEVANASVSAHGERGGSYFEVKTDTSGVYTLRVSGGSWWVEVRPSYEGTEPDWVYTGFPLQAAFAEDSVSESQTINFPVTATDAIISGVVKTPENTAVQYAWVDLNGNKGRGNGSQTDNQGRFSVKVPAGTYTVSVFSSLSNFGSPDPKSVTVASGATADAGTLYLKSKNSTIAGFVQDEDGNPISNVIVNAWLYDGAGWAMDSTDQTGAYSLSVWAGTWGVTVMPMSSQYVYQGNPQKITMTANETSNGNNFQLKIANKTLKVRVKKADGTKVSDIWGGVWVKDRSLGSLLDFGGPMEDMMTKAGMISSGGTAMGTSSFGPGMEQGGFSGGGLINGYTEINVPAGTYEVGLGSPPGSRYTLNGTVTTTVATTDTSKDVNLIVKENDATISGYFYLDADADDQYDTGEEVTGIRAYVNGDRAGGGWQFTESNALTGAYSLRVSGGDWYVDAFIDPFMMFGQSQYMVINEDVRVTVADGGAATSNFKVKRLDSVITGTVKNPDGSAMTGTGYGLVWVFADFGSQAMVDEFEGPGGPGLGTFTNADGTYSLRVPAGTYKIGAGIPPWDTRDLLDPNFVTVTVAAGGTSSGNDLQFSASNATIAGTITLNSAAQAGFVRAWSDSNKSAGTVTLDGSYSLKVTQGDTWHIVAAADVNNAYYESHETTVITVSGTSSYTQNLALASKNLTIPEGVSSSFDASQSQTVTLSKMVSGSPQDEVVLDIPAGAIATSGTITVSITPTVNVKPDAKDKPIGLSYNFEARDSSGNKIEEFVQNITIYMYYDQTLITDAGYSEDSITPKYYDTSTGSWENYSNVIKDVDNNHFIIKTNHFSAGGATGGDVPNTPTGLAAAAADSKTVSLSWTDNSNNETGFKIYRGGTLVTTTAANAVSYTDTGRSASTTYSYYIKATNGSGDSSSSSTVSVTTPASASSGGMLIIVPQSGGGGSSDSSSLSAPAPSTVETSKVFPAVGQKTVFNVKNEREDQVKRIFAEAHTVFKEGLSKILALLKQKQDASLEKKFEKLIGKVIAKTKITSETRAAINNFVVYGTPETRSLGQGERLGVINSFRETFGRFPASEDDWADVIKIGAGRFPKQQSVVKEKQAVAVFKKIYKRDPNLKNPNDSAALAVIAYGIRPLKRNLKSEVSAIATFKNVFKKLPSTAADFDTVRSVAYSGAKR
ncbi:MAG: hypothetical protein HY564_01505 [Candidatus Jacksonbacteria bacterium]|nr:hypothetical protein [Candidatus Jacksonbacteria bacterium]